MDIGIIGGADGPTVIMVTESQNGWFQPWGLVFVLLILLPIILYAVKGKGGENLCARRVMNLLEQVGRYGSMAAMVFDFGIGELGFSGLGSRIAFLAGNGILVLAYLLVWFLYWKHPRWAAAFWLAVLPGCIFLLSAAAMRDLLLGVFGLLFCVGHLYVTRANHPL